MNSDAVDWKEAVETNLEQEYRALLRSLRRTRNFGLFFVQCSPAEGERLIQRLWEDLPQKQLEVLSLREPIDNLYDVVAALPNKEQIDVLFIRGLEHSLYEYEKDRLWNDSGERYGYSESGVPRLLAHLNLSRERFRDHFQICFVFLVPLFVLKYLSRRAPDFFDWRSGVLEFAMDAEQLQLESLSTQLLRSDWKDYLALTPQERRDEILKIQALIEEPQQTDEQKAELYHEQALLYAIAGEYEEAIASLDQAVAIQPDKDEAWYNRGIALSDLGRIEEALASFHQAIAIKPDKDEAWYNRGIALFNLGRIEEALASYDLAIAIQPDFHQPWYNRGIALDKLGRYEEAIASFDRAVAIKPDYHQAWNNRGNALGNLGCYEEAIASHDKALELVLNYASALYNKACCYALQGDLEGAIENLQQAISLDSTYQEMAKNDSDFDGIREREQFQKLLHNVVEG